MKIFPVLFSTLWTKSAQLSVNTAHVLLCRALNAKVWIGWVANLTGVIICLALGIFSLYYDDAAAPCDFCAVIANTRIKPDLSLIVTFKAFRTTFEYSLKTSYGSA